MPDRSALTASYRLSRTRRLVNALVRPLARLALSGKRTHLLSVRGRTSDGGLMPSSSSAWREWAEMGFRVHVVCSWPDIAHEPELLTDHAACKPGGVSGERGITVTENVSEQTTVLFVGPKGAKAMEAILGQPTDRPGEEPPPP